MEDLNLPVSPEANVLSNAIIYQYLDSFLYDNAIFLAERWHAASKSNESLILLCNCYVRSCQYMKAFTLLKMTLSTSPVNRYLFGVSAFHLGKYTEVISALKQDFDNGEIGAAGAHILGISQKYLGQTISAKLSFQKALELDPFMFTSFSALSSLGEDIDVNLFFVPEVASESLIKSVTVGQNNVLQKAEPQLSVVIDQSQHQAQQQTKNQFKDMKTKVAAQGKDEMDVSNQWMETPSSIMYTPLNAGDATAKTPMGTPLCYFTPGFRSIFPPIVVSDRKPSRWIKDKEKEKNENKEQERNMITPSATTPLGPRTALQKKVLPRRKAAEKTTKPLNIESTTKETTRTKRFKGRHADDQTNMVNPLELDDEEDEDENRGLEFHEQCILTLSMEAKEITKIVVSWMNLLRHIAKGIIHLYQYRLGDALSVFKSIPEEQYNSGYILTLVARTYFEQTNYLEAEAVFEQIRNIEPYRLEGMETYSTVLWHLRKEVELAYLSHTLAQYDKLAPETWCVVGNCFSLQKDHESALKFFQRAIQLNPRFVYAYTLSGHEHVANDDLDKACQSFREALCLDSRHYNAWYGLGIVFQRQDKFDMAEYHFKAALDINPKNSVLASFLGTVLLKKYEKSSKTKDENLLKQSLECFSSAICTDANNHTARFRRAEVYRQLGKYKEAMDDITILKDAIPREAGVWGLIGKIYKEQNQMDLAMHAFTFALDLDAKDANDLKTEIEACSRSSETNPMNISI